MIYRLVNLTYKCKLVIEMSLFKKPRKQIQRRVFSQQDEDEEETTQVEDSNEKESRKKEKSKPKTRQPLLSFETEEDGEVFQIKKSSHSKKLMRMYGKEKKKKDNHYEKADMKVFKDSVKEIITDDLVVVVNSNPKPLSPPPPPLILSGRAALCAGRNDMSSDEEDSVTNHKFAKPDNFKKVLESGAIPDAAMIHAARKRRQRAREMGGEYVPLEEEELEDKGRLLREDDNEGSDEEVINMGANPVIRDQERRREQFYEAQVSDQEIDEWEDQQIRKGVTGIKIKFCKINLLY